MKAIAHSTGIDHEGDEMRIFVGSLIVLTVLYFWDKDFNNGKLLDGLDSMRRSIAHGMFR
jgi:hypothetical protein